MQTKKVDWGNVFIHTVMVLFCIACIVPLILVVSISISDEMEIVKHGYRLIPTQISILAYRYILENPNTLIHSYMITILVTIMGTVFGLLLVSSVAYVISRPDYKYRSITSFYLFFTMLFNGGLVPWYILITRYLHMKDTLFVLFIPYLVNVWYVMLMRGFLQTIPISMIESAKIDGACELSIFFRIIMPVSKPGLATIGLFYVLMYWNDWWLSLLYIDKKELVSLQYLLYKMMSKVEALTTIKNQYNINTSNVNLPTYSMRMATVILAAGPMLFIFPLFQKYFVKGLTVGAVKG